MDADKSTMPLSVHLDSLGRDLETLFHWKPSPRFLHRIRMFALSLGPNNHADLMALILCEASEWQHANETTHAKSAWGRGDSADRNTEREEAVLRAVDRERQRWRRAAERARPLDPHPPAPREGVDASGARHIDATDLADYIRSFVLQQLGEDDQKIFEARFEQGLEYHDIGQVLGGRYTPENLRQRAARIRKQILDYLKDKQIDARAALS